MSRNYRDYTEEDIINGAKLVKSLSGLLKLLNLRQAGGNFETLKKRLHELSVDCSHWTGQGWKKDVMEKDWASYSRTKSLRKHLLLMKNHTCESCGLNQWLNNPIPLEVHHIDGNRTNNNIENLQCLCPNCHAMTDTWRGKKNVGKGI